MNNCDCSPVDIKHIETVVSSVVDRVGKTADRVIPILQGVQDELRYLPSEALKYICEITEITPGQVSGVSTFYSRFRHIPAGEHIVKICTGTACHVKGASLVLDAFRRELKIDSDSSTTGDGRFSVEEVACLGCCTLAPVVQIGSHTYGHVKTTAVSEIIDDFLSRGDDKPVNIVTDNNESGASEIRVGLGSCCIAGGSKEILAEVEQKIRQHGLNAKIKSVGCVGVCNQTPLLELDGKNGEPVRYTNVRKEQVTNILLKHLKPPGKFKSLLTGVTDFLDTFHNDDKINSPVTLPDNVREQYLNTFLTYQFHIATEHYGRLSPFSIDEYIGHGGFKALEKAVSDFTPTDIRRMIKESGLRGRGGGGFSTGRKWDITASAGTGKKYVVCNGDEGDPGAFMDRMLIESFPYRVIEGMMIAAYATGADEGIFYIREEYPLAVERIKNAIEECRSRGIIDSNGGSQGFRFSVSLFEGAGAFVCGEETALIASMEGGRGNPHFRPPYPAEEGFNGRPTLVNNTETLCMVPWIINNGPEKFRETGTAESPGTKVFALAGKISRGGLIEVPMGISLRQVVENIGGGVMPGRTFKAVQIGGPSGGCIPASLSDTPIDFDALSEMGAMMGSGGLVVLDNTDCMVDMAKYFLTFTHEQSCGKCTFCRVGTKKMLDMLTRFSDGTAKLEDIDELERMAATVTAGSLCGLGRTAPNPVLTTIKYFREEYEAHTRGDCPSGKCAPLIKYEVNDNCIGCTLCARECPVDAIEYRPYEKHQIDNEKCIKCDSCVQICPAGAIDK